MLALLAGPDFEIGDALFVDLGREQQFEWIVTQPDVVLESNNGQAVVEDLESGFRALSLQAMSDDKHRLPLALSAQIFQGALRRGGAGELAGLVLVQLARQTPRTLDQLRGMRGMYSSEVERNGQALLATMQQALARPESEWPEVPRDRKPDPESTGVLELLQAVLKSRASMENIAPTLIATTGDLQALVDRTTQAEEVDIPVLRGWRRQLVGETLLSVLSGHLKVWIDPEAGKLRFGHLDHP